MTVGRRRCLMPGVTPRGRLGGVGLPGFHFFLQFRFDH